MRWTGGVEAQTGVCWDRADLVGICWRSEDLRLNLQSHNGTVRKRRGQRREASFCHIWQLHPLLQIPLDLQLRYCHTVTSRHRPHGDRASDSIVRTRFFLKSYKNITAPHFRPSPLPPISFPPHVAALVALHSSTSVFSTFLRPAQVVPPTVFGLRRMSYEAVRPAPCFILSLYGLAC